MVVMYRIHTLELLPTTDERVLTNAQHHSIGSEPIIKHQFENTSADLNDNSSVLENAFHLKDGRSILINMFLCVSIVIEEPGSFICPKEL